MIFFTSDTHFNHGNIIRLENTPFKTVEERDETIINHWNEVVGEHDIVYVLGDFAFNYDSDKLSQVLSRLKGYKTLILGNHDRVKPNRSATGWVEVCMYKEISIRDNHKNNHIILSHYPIAEWEKCWYGSIHLYGHCHGRFNLAEHTKDFTHHNTYCMDVGSCTNNYYPYSWEDIKKKVGYVL